MGSLLDPLKSRFSKSEKTSPESSGENDKSEKNVKKVPQKWTKNPRTTPF